MIFCFEESGKSVSPQISDVSDSTDYFLGVLHNPNSKIYRSIRYKNHVHLSLKQGTKNAVIFMQATEKALTIFNIIDCCSDIFLQKISMTHTNRFLISQHGLITLNGLKTTLPLF